MTEKQFTQYLEALIALINGAENRGVKIMQVMLLQELMASARIILEMLDD